MIENLENLTVITGGARSGKSFFAEELARASELPVAYIATMPRVPGDAELAYKVEQHQRRRPAQWKTIEAELAIHEHFAQLPFEPGICVVDCLSLYISNIMLDWLKSVGPVGDREYHLDRISAALLQELDSRVNKATTSLIGSISRRSEISFIIVTNEVGWSVVPENRTARVYKDLLGNANQAMARAAATVYLACIGLQLKLKENGVVKLV